jgi:iron complex outermembrane receptor protein
MSLRSSIRLILLTGTAVASVPAVGVAQPAGDSQVRNGLEEIIVTARRREENLQSVPISVTALTGEQLAQSGVTSVRDLQSHVPSLVVAPQGTSRSVVGFGIRGMRSTSFLVLDDPAVGTYFAEAVQVRTYGFGESLYDIQSIQVLKGPQGTLFGRNNTGGAILVEPNKPDLSGFSALTKIGAGNYGLRQGSGFINLPMGEKMAFRLAGSIKRTDGYSTNVLNGQKWDDDRNESVRASFLFEPTDGITSTTIFDLIHADQAPDSARLTGFTPLVSAGFRALFTPALDAQNARDISQFASTMGTNGPQDGFAPARCVANPNLKCRAGLLPEAKLRNWGVLNNTSIEMGDLTLKNIASYRNIHYVNEGADIVTGGSSLSPGIQSMQNNDSNTVSDELQLLGKALNGELDWITGAFYLRERGTEFAPNYQFTTANWNATTGDGENKSYAVFAQGTYHITEALSSTLGARYSWDKREAEDKSYSVNGATGAKTCQVRDNTGALLPGDACVLAGNASFSEPTWTASLEYQATDHALLYLTSRRGYKSGGFSLRAHRGERFGYDPEFVTDFETGLKADWNGAMPVRTNLALFYSKYKDIQRLVTDTTLTPTVTYIFNAAKAHVTGGELEFTVIPVTGLELSAYVSMAKARYDDYTDPSTTAAGLSDPLRGSDLSSQRFQLIPDYQGGVSLQYTLPLPAAIGEVSLRGDYFRQSEMWWDPTKAAEDATHQPGYGLLNLRADWNNIMGIPLDFGAFVTNAADKEYRTGGAVVAGIVNTTFGPPRMYGAEFTYHFGSSR